MKSMRVKKAVVTALVAVMMAGSIGVMPQGGSTVQAAEPEIKEVNLGTKGISNPDPCTTEGWQESKTLKSPDNNANVGNPGGFT